MKKLEVLALKEVGEILKIVEADILTASVNNERVMRNITNRRTWTKNSGLMNKKYKVEVTVEDKNDTYLSITRNSFLWSSLNIKDPVAEIPFIIAALQRHLSFVVLDSKD